MTQQFLNMVFTIFLVRFMLNDVPHLLDTPASPNPPANTAKWEDIGLIGLTSFLRSSKSEFGPHYIDELFGTSRLVPAVEPTLKRYIIGYYLIAMDKHDRTVVDDTYGAIKSMWRIFKGWLNTSKLEEQAGETAKFIRGEIRGMIVEVDRGILLVDSGGLKIEFIDSFTSNEHISQSLVLHGFIDTFQEVPAYFELSMMNYYAALAGRGQ